MTITAVYIFASIFVVSLVSLVGVFFLFLKESILKEFTKLLIGLSVGALLGGASFHLLPEIFRSENPIISASLLFGIFAFFFLEKLLHWHHDHSVHSLQKENCPACNKIANEHKKPLGKMVVFSDALHNALDGALIASAFLVNPTAGLATTLAVLLHELPQEIADFGVLLHSGFSKTKAMALNFISALSAFLGAGFVILFKDLSNVSIPYFTAFAAGSLLYIAMADLIPELHKHRKPKDVFTQFCMVSTGVLIMFAITLLE